MTLPHNLSRDIIVPNSESAPVRYPATSRTIHDPTKAAEERSDFQLAEPQLGLKDGRQWRDCLSGEGSGELRCEGKPRIAHRYGKQSPLLGATGVSPQYPTDHC